MNVPAFAVGIPAHNAEASIGRAVRSAFEAGASTVLVVDDGSVDATAARAKQAGAQVLRQENKGAAATRERCIRVSVLEYLILLDADDVLMRPGLTLALVDIGAHPDWIGVIGAYSIAAGDAERTVKPWSEGVTLSSLLRRGYAPAPPGSIVWRRERLVTALAGPPEPLRPRWAEDFELLVRAAQIGPFGIQDSPVCGYSISGGKSAKNPSRSIDSSEQIRRYYASANGIDIRLRSRRDVRALTLARRAQALNGPLASLVRAYTYLVSPLMYVHLGREKLRRRGAARRFK